MSAVLNFLDCGCAIMTDGRRSWCPTCEQSNAGPTISEPAMDDTRRLDDIEFFGCMTGDCPHDTQAECDVAILGVVRSVVVERDYARQLKREERALLIQRGLLGGTVSTHFNPETMNPALVAMLAKERGVRIEEDFIGTKFTNVNTEDLIRLLRDAARGVTATPTEKEGASSVPSDAELRKALHLACGRIGGHLGPKCGCYEDRLDASPDPETRRAAAVKYIETVLRERSERQESTSGGAPAPTERCPNCDYNEPTRKIINDDEYWHCPRCRDDWPVAPAPAKEGANG